jgi:predicted RNA-binding protein
MYIYTTQEKQSISHHITMKRRKKNGRVAITPLKTIKRFIKRPTLSISTQSIHRKDAIKTKFNMKKAKGTEQEESYT